MRNECEMCSESNGNVILSCGCLLCPKCYLQTKLFTDDNYVNCILCGKVIFLSETINIYNKNIIGQIHKNNKKENNEKILVKLKVNNNCIK